MDDRRFDELAKSMVAGGSRRAVLRGAMVAGLAAAFGWREHAAAAACRERQRLCSSVDQCCGGMTACRQVTKPTCGLTRTRCCGIEGASCDVDLDGCDCCRDLICNPLTNRCNLPI